MRGDAAFPDDETVAAYEARIAELERKVRELDAQVRPAPHPKPAKAAGPGFLERYAIIHVFVE